MSTYSCHGIPLNPLRYKGFGVFHCSSHVICFFLILGHFSLFVGRFVGTLLASPTIFFIFYTLLDSSQCPLAREVICRNRHQTFTLQFVAGFGFWFLQGYLQKVTLRHKSKPDGTASYDNNFVIRQSLFLGKRCQKDSLNALAHRGRSQVIFTFPEWKQTDSTTSLVLKSPKTESSVRKVYLPRTVALALREVKSTQDALKLLIGDEYADYGLVIAHEDGRPYEERQIAALLRKLIAENDLRPVVFHSLRHCSASLKLQIGGGNIKAVQGDTGHAQARMVTDLYAHTHNEDRRRLAQKVDEDFFQKRPSEAKKAVAHEADLAYQLLQDNPDIAKLIIATLQKKSS